jgi:hypothetical protein
VCCPHVVPTAGLRFCCCCCRRLLLEGADVSDAVSAPRVHDQLLPQSNTYYENYTCECTCCCSCGPIIFIMLTLSLGLSHSSIAMRVDVLPLYDSNELVLVISADCMHPSSHQPPDLTHHPAKRC